MLSCPSKPKHKNGGVGTPNLQSQPHSAIAGVFCFISCVFKLLVQVAFVGPFCHFTLVVDVFCNPSITFFCCLRGGWKAVEFHVSTMVMIEKKKSSLAHVKIHTVQHWSKKYCSLVWTKRCQPWWVAWVNAASNSRLLFSDYWFLFSTCSSLDKCEKALAVAP